MRTVEMKRARRRELCGETAFELNHPDRVEPYCPEKVSRFERDPARADRVLFTVSPLPNGVLALLLVR